jgi:hypothetical protein
MPVLKYVYLTIYAIGFRQKEADAVRSGRLDKTALRHERRNDVPSNVRPFRVLGTRGGKMIAGQR